MLLFYRCFSIGIVLLLFISFLFLLNLEYAFAELEKEVTITKLAQVSTYCEYARRVVSLLSILFQNAKHLCCIKKMVSTRGASILFQGGGSFKIL